MFLQLAQSNPQFYFAVLITVVVSIVIHELAHGWMAIKLGDDTPLYLNRMTLNPLVHMGWLSLLMLVVTGIAWGQMPVDSTRLRGRYAEALVAAAGPVSNLLLALAGLTVLGIWLRLDPGILTSENHVVKNALTLLEVFGMTNVMLMLLNLIPLPPLDGSRIVANFVPAYRDLLMTPQAAGIALGATIFVFMVAGRYLWPLAMDAAGWYLRLIV